MEAAEAAAWYEAERPGLGNVLDSERVVKVLRPWSHYD